MIQAVESYLSMRRAAGFELKNADYLLHSFARFAAERGETRRPQSRNTPGSPRSGHVAPRRLGGPPSIGTDRLAP